MLLASCNREGVQTLYQTQPGCKTGACAVVVTGHDRCCDAGSLVIPPNLCSRSLVTALEAARMLDLSHFKSSIVQAHLASSRVIYVEGFILSHALDIVLHLGERSAAEGKAS